MSPEVMIRKQNYPATFPQPHLSQPLQNTSLYSPCHHLALPMATEWLLVSQGHRGHSSLQCGERFIWLHV